MYGLFIFDSDGCDERRRSATSEKVGRGESGKQKALLPNREQDEEAKAMANVERKLASIKNRRGEKARPDHARMQGETRAGPYGAGKA